jgi:PhnB protein
MAIHARLSAILKSTSLLQHAPQTVEVIVMSSRQPLISVMLAVANASAALAWYKQALGATELWNLGGVVGMEIDGAPIFLGEPEQNGWETPMKLGVPSARIEVFCDDPDAFIARALKAGAKSKSDPIRNHQMPWGTHRQGSFVDPFGHLWMVGDRSPLSRHP